MAFGRYAINFQITQPHGAYLCVMWRYFLSYCQTDKNNYMEYQGKLYGKVGKSYFPLEATSEDFDNLQNKVKEYEEKLQKQNEILLKITGWDRPYNLTEILSRLVFATDYLLHVKNYDGHAHEELNQSIDMAKEILQFLETREAHFL